MNEERYYIRNHNIFTSGNCLSSPANGSTNIYREDKDGNGIFDLHLIDLIYDNYLLNNFIPIVELGFMPFDLVEKKNDFTSDWKMGNDTGREIYQLNQWKSPPKDYLKWQFLVEQFVKHLYERYGQQINQWFF